MIFTAAAGMAAVSGIMQSAAAAQKGAIEARRMLKQNAARIRQMQDQFDLSTQNLHNNNVEIKQNKMKNNMLIEENKLDAEDRFAQAFVGSGISGRTKDVMSASMQNEVAKAHNQASQLSVKESDRQFLGLMRQSDQIKAQIQNLEMFDVGANEANISMAGMSAALSSFAGSYSGDFGLGGAAKNPNSNAFKLNDAAFNRSRNIALK